MIVSGGCYFLGGFGRLFDAEALYKADGSVMYDAIVPSMLSTLPDLLIGVVIILVLSASMSTLSSLVLTSASTLTLDFIKGNIVKEMDDKKQLIYIRVLIVFFIVISVVLALQSANLYRAANGHFMGCACRCVPRAVFVWLILEGRYQSRGVGEFSVRRWNHRFEYVFQIYRFAHQRRRGGNDCRPDYHAGCESGDTENQRRLCQ